MEPKSSLPFSQEPAISPCPEGDESIPHPSNLFFNLHFNTVLKSMSHTLQMVSFLQVFLQKPSVSFPFQTSHMPQESQPSRFNHPNRI